MYLVRKSTKVNNASTNRNLTFPLFLPIFHLIDSTKR
jgi:hypothetical protein